MSLYLRLYRAKCASGYQKDTFIVENNLQFSDL